LRPGKQKRGAEAKFLELIINKKALRDLKKGEGVSLEDCSD